MKSMNNETEENFTRLRRCKSVTRAEDIQKVETELRKAQSDRPCHKPRDSLFSWSSGFSNFTGFVNWAFLLLSVGGTRLFLENIIKYGIRVDPSQWVIFLTGSQEGGPEHLSVMLFFYSFVPVLICFTLEKGLSTDIISHGLGSFVHILNIVLLIIIPIVVIQLKPEGFSLIGASVVCFTYSILFLKLWSYIQVNMWCRLKNETKSMRRQRSLSSNRLDSEINGHNSACEVLNMKIVQYPDNLTLKDLFYFIFAPTLCYELNFPRTCRIRKRFLIKRAIEVLVGFQVLVALFQQWIIPSVKNSLIPFSNMDVAKATERLLKLAIPNHLVWLIWFYLFFHSFLNLMGELLHFADRNFYSDWWNSNNIETFWRTWNVPVHKWGLRHLYIPLVELGYSKNVAAVSVFFLSAFFHEYLVSVPLKIFKHWAFLGMMCQIPMSHFSKLVERRFGPRCGNCIVWAGLILGQPLCIMMYYHDYVISRFGEPLIGLYAKVHPWEKIAQATWRKYPNPMNTAVIGTDVVERKVVEGILYTHRLVSSQWLFPEWARPFVGSTNICYASEVSQVDPVKKEMVLKTKNLSLCKYITVDETVRYIPHPSDPGKTLLKQAAVVTVQGMPFTSYVESIMTKRISSNAGKGRQAIEWVISKIEAEAQELKNSAVKTTDEFINQAKKSIDDLTNSAKKSMDELSSAAKISFLDNFTNPPTNKLPKF